MRAEPAAGLTAGTAIATGPGRLTWWSPGLLAPAGVVVALAAVFIARCSFVVGGVRYFSLTDDAMISMVYARRLATGQGLTWPGPVTRVEGFTNLSWTVLMAGLHLLHLPPSVVSLAVMVCGAVALLAAVPVAAALGRQLQAPDGRLALPSAWVVALYFPVLFWTLRGMEVGLLALLVLLAVVLALAIDSGRRSATGPLCAVAVAGMLARTDFLLPMVVVITFLALRRHRLGLRPALLVTVATVAAAAAHSLASLAFYGDLLPNTYYLKLQGEPLATRMVRGVDALLTLGLFELYLPLALLAAFAVARWRALDARVLLPLGVVGAVAAYVVYIGGDAVDTSQVSDRFIAPVVPLLLVATVHLGGRALAGDHGQLARWSRVAAGVLVAVAAVRGAGVNPEASFGFGVSPAHSLAWLVGPPLLAAAGLLALPYGVRVLLGPVRGPTAATPGSAGIRRPLAGIGLAVLMMGFVVGPEVATWARSNAIFVSTDNALVRCGLLLGRTTAPGVVVATPAAGSIPYYSGRATVDLLGYNDPVIARERPATGHFVPGHDKWDYARSVGLERPDVVFGLWPAGSRLVADQVVAYGYREVSRDLLVREGAAGVDVAALTRGYAGGCAGG